jgi:hypothetical protein
MDEAVDAGKRFVSLFAFPQFGKSFGIARHVEPYLLQPDNHGWIVAPTYQDGYKEFSYIHQDFGAVEFNGRSVLSMATTRHFDVRGGNMVLEFPWGSWVRVVSADNPDSLRQEQLDWVILAEASKLPSNIYERNLFARIELRNGKCFVPTTPKGFNWLHQAFRIPSLETVNFTYGPWEANRRARVGGKPNPVYDPLFWSAVVSAVPDFGEILEPGVHRQESVDRARRLLPRQVFAEQFGGDFASYAGTIYPDFNVQDCFCAPFEIPDGWPTIVGWDHGAREENPTAVEIGSYSPDGTIYWWGEIYLGRRSVGEYHTLLRATLGRKRETILAVDPSALQVRVELSKLGVASTEPKIKDVHAGIIVITAAIREGKFKIFRGHCPNLVEEFGSYEWDEKEQGKPRPRQRCHALDAIRYVMTVPVTMPPQEQALTEMEDPRVTRMWKSVRSQRAVEKQAKEYGAVMDSLEDDPFAENIVEDFEVS